MTGVAAVVALALALAFAILWSYGAYHAIREVGWREGAPIIAVAGMVFLSLLLMFVAVVVEA